MKHYIKTITWKFKDSGEDYPQLKNKKVRITSPTDMYNNFSFLFEGEVKERFIVIWLNTQNTVVGFEIISEGLLNSSLVHPREVFRGAIVATCNSIILAHNHPSGNLEPSREDIEITKRLSEVGKIIDIKVLDHIIFSDEGYASLVEKCII